MRYPIELKLLDSTQPKNARKQTKERIPWENNKIIQNLAKWNIFSNFFL